MNEMKVKIAISLLTSRSTRTVFFSAAFVRFKNVLRKTKLLFKVVSSKKYFYKYKLLRSIGIIVLGCRLGATSLITHTSTLQ